MKEKKSFKLRHEGESLGKTHAISMPGFNTQEGGCVNE